MIREFEYKFNQLNIIPADIEELLGFENHDTPEPFPELILKGLSDAPEYCNIRGGVKTFDSVAIDQKAGTLKIENQILLPAKIVMLQIKETSSIAVFACTAGNGISNYSKSFAEKGDQLMSYIMDIIGSVVVEKAVAKIENEIESMLKPDGVTVSDSYSPGYCEWDVKEQQKLFRLLPPDFCGIKLTDSSLMNPIKSVSGIIGIGKNLKKKGYQCYWCNDLNCIYGKRKRKKLDKKVG